MATNQEKKNAAYKLLLETFKIVSMKDYQIEVLEKLLGSQDVFIIQPTGSGKSLIYQTVPVVFDFVSPLSHGKSIALVILLCHPSYKTKFAILNLLASVPSS